MNPDTPAKIFQIRMNGFSLAYGTPPTRRIRHWAGPLHPTTQYELRDPTTYIGDMQFFFAIRNPSSGWSGDYSWDNSGNVAPSAISRYETGGPATAWRSFETDIARTLDDFDKVQCWIKGRPDIDTTNQEIEYRMKQGPSDAPQKMWCFLDMKAMFTAGMPAIIQTHFQADKIFNFRVEGTGLITLLNASPFMQQSPVFA